jgi:Type III restriction enzyme, res subunit
MLSFKDRLTLQNIVNDQDKILSKNPKFTIRLAAQNLKLDALTRLGIVANIDQQAINDSDNNENIEPEIAEVTAHEVVEQEIIAPSLNNEALKPVESKKSTAQFFEYDPNRKPAQRKKENTAAMALIRQIEAGEVDSTLLTDEQKATLAKYSGLGGALIGIDGQKGSDYEYYTPKPIAEGVWDLAKALGFTGGKVLDPCSGVGIFGATSPENAIVDAIELDKTSGLVNKLVNGGVGSTVTIAPFEKVAASTPDEFYDAVVSNVPFGDNAARGNNKSHDKRYQKESLQAYFILRSLEKLKPGGLAVFIVPPSVVTGRGSKEESLRVRASYMAEFLGAYRLPNTVFGTAAADTITDIIAFRKYKSDAAEKIVELKEQNPDTLIAAKVQWDEFVGGLYFKGEGKRFVLGEFIPKDPNDMWSRDQIVNTASMGEIGAMLRKFPDSRVDWALLDATETDVIMYNEGDTVTQAGVTLQWTNNQWVALEKSNDNTAITATIATLTDPYAAFHAKVTFDTAIKARDFMVAQGIALDVPGWLRDTLFQIEKTPLADRQKYWNAGVIGLSCAQILEARLSEETGVNYLEEYVELSDAMQRIAATAKASASKVGGDLKQGLLKIGLHYTAKGGFSALWRGDILQNVAAVATTHDATFDGLLYKNKSSWATIEEAKSIYGEDFEPMTDSKWCISSDGKQVIRADDYYVGGYADFIKKVDADIAAATDEAVIAKLLRQKVDAESYLDKIDVKSLSFNLFSPHVTHEEKAEFLRKFGYPDAAVIYDEKTGDKRVDVDMKITKNSTGKDKLANRMGDYMKNGTISLGGAETGMSTANALRELRRMVNTANEQFNGWAAANQQIMNRLEAKANAPELLTFKQVDDEAPMKIPGMNPALSLHPYQNSFVRKMGRDFSGINGFAVGLGKTFSALAAVQYSQAIGVKRKALFVVPNSVLSNWKKEATTAYESIDDCLFVGLRADKKGKMKVDSKAIDTDLTSVMENRHSKIFITFETFMKIKLREETIDKYEAYLGITDSNYAASQDVKEREAANSKKDSIRTVLMDKSGAAPFMEDLGIDSIVIDEAHGFKASAAVFNFKSAKFLSLSSMAKRGIDAQCKAWYVRGTSPRGDGMLLLTATPITNSPLEIFSMLSLAKGHDKVNKMMLGINGADDFMNMFTNIENVDDVTIDGIDRTTNVFTGLNNVGVLRGAIAQSSTIKSAADVGEQVELPDSEDVPSTVTLAESTVERLQLYKEAFRWAIDDLSDKKGPDNRGDRAAYDAVLDYFGETQALIGHPFNLINKMTMLIADPELDKRATFFTIVPGNEDKAKAVIEAFNKKKFKDKRPRMSPFTQDDAVVGKKIVTDDETGDKYEELTIEVRAMLQPDNKTIVIDTMNGENQLRWDEMTEKAGLDLDVSIPPKLAALLENVQAEQATPRGIDDDGKKSTIVKQIIFSDILAMHSKIKRILAKKAGISSAKIAIITGKTNNTPDEIMAVQDGFNAHGEDNIYQIIIANEKAEVGINLQKGTQAIHHLSIGWTPDSLTQRNGRGVRQGNKTKKVTIYTYDADGTFDAIKRDMVNKKADWIGHVMAADGDNNVSISGGMSKEQLEALIDVTGDSDAMSRIQETIAAKEAEARASTNIAKQKVNIDTIVKQRKFIEDNDPVTDFIIPKIASLYTISNQIKMLQSRIENPKATATAVVKNQAILGELKAKQQGISEELARSVLIKKLKSYQDTEGEVITAEQAIEKYLGGWTKGNRHTSEGLAEDLGRGYNYKIEVIEGSFIHTDWVAELAMAQSMIDSALSNFSQQAKQAGGLPEAVGKAFAEGKATIDNGQVVTVGSFVRKDVFLCIVTADYGLLMVKDGSASSTTFPPKPAYILPGSSDYEACLIEAAKLEDASTLNTYSEIVLEVAKYRTTARVKSYNAALSILPQPYFPIVFSEDQIKGNDLLQMLYTEQNKLIVSRDNSRSLIFTVPFESDIQDKPRDLSLYSALMDYAKGHNKKLAWNMVDDRTFNNVIEYKLAPIFKGAESDLSLLMADKTTIDEINKTFTDFVQSKVDFIDFSGATADDIRLLIPFQARYVYECARRDAERAIEQAAGEKEQPELPATTTEEAAAVKFGESEGGPDDIVAIVGNTMHWKGDIKIAATRSGDGKYKWDKRAGAWNVKRKAWTALVRSYPGAAKDLKIIPATIARF